MSSSRNKKQLIQTLCDTPHGNPLLHLVGEDQRLFDHEEADVNTFGVQCVETSN